MDKKKLSEIEFLWAKIETSSGFANAELAGIHKYFARMQKAAKELAEQMSKLTSTAMATYLAAQECCDRLAELRKTEDNPSHEGKE